MNEFSASAVVNFIDGNQKFTAIAKGIKDGKPDFSEVTLTESIIRTLAEHGLTKEDLPKLKATESANSAFRAFTYDLTDIHREEEAKVDSNPKRQPVLNENVERPLTTNGNDVIDDTEEVVPDINIDLINISKQGKNGVKHLTFAGDTAGTKLYEEIKNNQLSQSDVLLTPKSTIVAIPRVVYYLKDSVLSTVLDENEYKESQNVQIIANPSSTQEQDHKILQLNNDLESVKSELKRAKAENESLKLELTDRNSQETRMNGQVDGYYKERYTKARDEINHLKNRLEDASVWEDKFQEVKISEQVNERMLVNEQEKNRILSMQNEELAQKYEVGQRQVRSVFDAMRVASEFLTTQVPGAGENTDMLEANVGGHIE